MALNWWLMMFSAFFQGHPVILKMPIWRLQAIDFSRVERMMLQVGINQWSHQFLLEVSETYGTFLGLLLISPLLISQFTPLNLSRNRLWKFWNKGHLVTIKTKNKKTHYNYFTARLLSWKNHYPLTCHWKASMIPGFPLMATIKTAGLEYMHCPEALQYHPLNLFYANS